MTTFQAPKRTEQLTITFPKLKGKYKRELMRQRKRAFECFFLYC